MFVSVFVCSQHFGYSCILNFILNSYTKHKVHRKKKKTHRNTENKYKRRNRKKHQNVT